MPLRMVLIRSMSGGPSGGDGSMRPPAGSLIAMTSTSKPPGVKMKSGTSLSLRPNYKVRGRATSRPSGHFKLARGL